jgi:chaperone modulatory protein CbpM
MTLELTQAYFVGEDVTFSLTQLTQRTGLSEEEVHALIESGAFSPLDPRAERWAFSTQCIVIARRARRLREQFALEDAHSLAVVLRLAQRIEELEARLRDPRDRF